MTPPPKDTDEPIRVLLVEDQMDDALLLKRMLREAGAFEVTHAQDGDRAVELAEPGRFDVVLTDLNLPGTDGFDLIRHVKRGSADIPVLATTGYTNPQYADQAFRAGVDGVLYKPIDSADLMRRLREALPDRLGTEEAPAPATIAVGARPGDVELGCGGTLLRRAAAGDELLVLLLSSETDGADGAAGARAAAEQLGARLILADTAVSDPSDSTELQLLIERIARELKPDVAFTPSLADDDPARREVHRLCRAALSEVSEVYAYQTATSSVEFRPDRFEDVGEQMAAKVEMLAAYGAADSAHRELSPGFAQATARYWGRFADFGQAEPLETIRSAGADAAEGPR